MRCDGIDRHALSVPRGQIRKVAQRSRRGRGSEFAACGWHRRGSGLVGDRVPVSSDTGGAGDRDRVVHRAGGWWIGEPGPTTTAHRRGRPPEQPGLRSRPRPSPPCSPPTPRRSWCRRERPAASHRTAATSAHAVVSGTTVVARTRPGIGSPRARRHPAYPAPTEIATSPSTRTLALRPNNARSPACHTTAHHTRSRPRTTGVRAAVRQARLRGATSTTTAADSSKHHAVAPTSSPTAVPCERPEHPRVPAHQLHEQHDQGCRQGDPKPRDRAGGVPEHQQNSQTPGLMTPSV